MTAARYTADTFVSIACEVLRVRIDLVFEEAHRLAEELVIVVAELLLQRLEIS